MQKILKALNVKVDIETIKLDDVFIASNVSVKKDGKTVCSAKSKQEYLLMMHRQITESLLISILTGVQMLDVTVQANILILETIQEEIKKLKPYLPSDNFKAASGALLKSDVIADKLADQERRKQNEHKLFTSGRNIQVEGQASGMSESFKNELSTTLLRRHG